jgi:hypothetical protein
LTATRTSGAGDMPELKGLTRRCDDLVAFDHLSFTVAEE